MRIAITELKEGHFTAHGVKLSNAKLAKKLHKAGDTVSEEHLRHLLTRWNKGERLGSSIPYLLRLSRFFNVTNINTLIAGE